MTQTHLPPSASAVNRRRPVKRYVAAGLFMALVALLGYGLADTHPSVANEQPIISVVTTVDASLDAGGTSANLAAPTAALLTPVSPTELAAIKADMALYARQLPVLTGVQVTAPPTAHQPAAQPADLAVQAAVDTTLDAMMATLHTMLAQVDATPVMPAPVQTVLPGQ